MYAVWGSICVLLRLDSTTDNLNLKTTDLSLLMSMKFLVQWLESQSCIFENETYEQDRWEHALILLNLRRKLNRKKKLSQ